MIEEKFDAVIVANGQFPCHEIPLGILRKARYVVACDGAITSLQKAGIKADVIIGDGDSVPAEFHDLLIQISEQDDNDLTKATRYCVSNLKPQPTANSKPLRIAYLGATGLREDHTLGNIGLLMRYYRQMDVEGTMFTDYGFFTPAYGNRTFTSKSGQQVSIFNFGCTKLISEGLRWDSYAYDEWWQGTLNEAIGYRFSFCADGYYMVYQTYDTK
jgi:thiamine pyrophosphokinase